MLLRKIKVVDVLKLACLCLLLGRAWQYFYWSTPIFGFFWDESWWQPITEKMGWEWDYFANYLANERFINFFVKSQALLFVITSVLVLFYKKGHRFTSFLLWFCSILLVFLAFCYMKDKLFVAGQFWEYALQFSCPILLWAYVQLPDYKRVWGIFVKIAIVLTFTCHGLYASGIYNIPGKFIDMTIEILGVSQAQAIVFLKAAGIMDFILSIALFIPHRKVVISALIYATLWGLATSAARIFAYVDLMHFWAVFMEWVPHAIYRLPHGLIPLALLVLIWRKD